ncbi:retinol dehydrogenase 8-like [Scleropages formosus]|uniref:Retinol dehydrogenase 8-like n=1 Tax=Scleropages formosus TaxID=113540 RepID=A0A0P7YL89_SCLFO|nr:retinol dehydrogenase 8-like [Scleropages formosus]
MASDGQKVVLITGCSSGIGLRVAVLLAKDDRKRYHVIATMRDTKRKDKLLEAAGDTYGKTLTLQTLDVCSEESVKQCINSIKDRRVDILINNAGIGLLGPVESISIEEMKKVFETNFFGMVRMIKEVMPDMKMRRSGHIIVMSSVMGLQGTGCVGLDGGRWKLGVAISVFKSKADWVTFFIAGVVFNDVYTASKFAMEGFCESLAVQLLKFNVNVSMIEPGPVHTEFEVKMMQDVAKMEYPGADADTVRYFKDVYLPSSLDIFEAMGQSPEDIARCIKKVIEARRPRFRNLTNSLYTPIVAMKYADETGGLSVHTFYNLLFNFGPLMHITMNILKCLTCSCLRRRTISPN